jgi:glutamine amidotransferase-like uncharacterized protein
MLVGLLFLLALTLTLNTGIIFATESTTGNSSNTGSAYGSNSAATKNTTNYAAGSETQTQKAAGSTKTIKVLIYSGSEASINCVNGIKQALNYANSNNIVPNVVFTYATSTKITSATLTGYDVLAMPGGSGGYYYLNSGSISGSAIKNFVSSGKGYIGICAGAYSATARTDNYYNGWGIAPNVYAKAVSYIGNVPIQITSAGTQVLGSSGTVTISHYNGAAMYVSGNAVTFATYGDSKTGYKGYAAIVGDYYGKGRTVLSGPHPELSSNLPTYVSKLIYWAAGGTSSSTPTNSTLTQSQVAAAASKVKTFYETNKRLPNYVTTPAGQITMPNFLNLLATATTQANSGSTAAIKVINVNSPSSWTGTNKKGNIQKSEILAIAQTIKSFISTNGRAPNFVTTSLGNLSSNSVVYMFSKIMAFYNTNKRLPNFVSM